MKIENEIWKSVKGFEGYYEVSNLGRVKSLCRTIRNQSDKEVIIYREYFPKQWDNKGYKVICLSRLPKILHTWVHRLVAEAFITNPENKPYVNHKNGIKNDNRLENLEWCTQKENMEHAWRSGLSENARHIGEDHPRSYVTEEKVLAIRKYKEENPKTSYREIAEIFGLNHLITARDIIKRYSWNHI